MRTTIFLQKNQSLGPGFGFDAGRVGIQKLGLGLVEGSGLGDKGFEPLRAGQG